MKRWEFTVNEATPSANAHYKQHWTAAYKTKQRWAVLLLRATIELNIPKAQSKRLLQVIRYSTRQLDIDNLYGGLKGVLDNLVKFGIIKDDKPSMLNLVASQDKCPKGTRPYTKFILTDDVVS